MKRILVAVDFSKVAAEGLRLALDLGGKLKSRLLLVHVVHDPTDTPGFYASRKAGKKVLRNIEESAQEMMDDFVAKQLKNYEDFESILVPGLPAEQIVRLADEKKADLIIIGTRGHSGLERFMLGSVADKVIRTAPCPVITVRSRRAARKGKS